MSPTSALAMAAGTTSITERTRTGPRIRWPPGPGARPLAPGVPGPRPGRQITNPTSLDPRYALPPPDAVPHSESLRYVQARLSPYWYEAIVPTLAANRVALIGAHGSPLRALITHLDGVSEAGIATVNVPIGIPLRYELDEHLIPRAPGGCP